MTHGANNILLVKIQMQIKFSSGYKIFILIGALFTCLEGCNLGPTPAYDFLNSMDFFLTYPTHYLNSDSVLKAVDKYPGLSQKLDTLLFGAYVLKDHEERTALIYALRASKVATENNQKMAKALSSYYVALLKGRLDQQGEAIPDAMIDARIAQRIFAQLKEEGWIIRTDNLWGIFYNWLGKRDSAKYYLFKANNAIERAALNSTEKIGLKAEVLHDLGAFYLQDDSSMARALNYFRRSQELYQRSGNLPAYTRLLQEIGDLFMYENNYDSAYAKYNQSLTYAKEQNDVGNIFSSFIRIGNAKFYEAKSDVSLLQEAEENYQNSLQVKTKKLFDSYIALGGTFVEQYLADPQKIDFLDSAIVYSKKGLDLAREEGVFHSSNVAIFNLINACQEKFTATGDWGEDLIGLFPLPFAVKHYESILDSNINYLQTVSLRNRKLVLDQQNEVHRNRTRTFWLISGAGLLVTVLIFLLIAQQLQQKRLQARMEALRAQINPHFISNSLNAIENLINQDKKESAGKYLIHFSRLSRRILNGSREAIGTLHDELEMLKHFLALEQLRFKDKLAFSIEVEEGIFPKLVKVPNMILQPYVENAIWHGIKPKTEPGILSIKVSKENKFLLCSIEDDGIGREKSRELKAASIIPHKSQGMAITEERLHVFNKKKKNQIEIVDLYTQEGEPRGTRVLVRIPYKAIKPDNNS